MMLLWIWFLILVYVYVVHTSRLCTDYLTKKESHEAVSQILHFHIYTHKLKNDPETILHYYIIADMFGQMMNVFSINVRCRKQVQIF